MAEACGARNTCHSDAVVLCCTIGAKACKIFSRPHNEIRRAQRVEDELRKYNLAVSPEARDEQGDSLIAAALSANDAVVFEQRQYPSDAHNALSEFEVSEVATRERRVALSLGVEALALPLLVERRLVDLAGARYNPETHRVRLVADSFAHYAQNKHAVVRMAQALLDEAFRADSNYVPLSASSFADAASAASAADERLLLDEFAEFADGASIDNPLNLGPALAPASFVQRVADDIAVDEALARGAAVDSEPMNADAPLNVFTFGRLPPQDARAAAAANTESIVASLIEEAA